MYRVGIRMYRCSCPILPCWIALTDNHLGLTYQSLVADISYGTLTYVRNLNTCPEPGGLGVRYLNYGDFQGI